ncbi:hypothetical protein [Aureibacter tunicatorum]|uniref:Uncharacterized protein n=1 Tax=Aureibacter tunicatorum TaxID=866807 RepID=A0AAE3XPG3_9BACT|nr:hypothetical protein [Aureibacter tunicatorum]MDR6240722.1 hypothetical protein [Aureibacter tunicatorum]BDD06945.1 hypothetical protein AUTU_44280 [Aureibacter tunicatorum]
MSNLSKNQHYLIEKVSLATKNYILNKDPLSILEKHFEDNIEIGESIEESISLDIHNGYGITIGKEAYTYWASLRGYWKVTSPLQGRWSIKVIDTISGQSLFEGSGIASQTEVPFFFKTGFKTQLKVETAWSESDSATLNLHVKCSF